MGGTSCLHGFAQIWKQHIFLLAWGKMLTFALEHSLLNIKVAEYLPYKDFPTVFALYVS